MEESGDEGIEQREMLENIKQEAEVPANWKLESGSKYNNTSMSLSDPYYLQLFGAAGMSLSPASSDIDYDATVPEENERGQKRKHEDTEDLRPVTLVQASSMIGPLASSSLPSNVKKEPLDDWELETIFSFKLKDGLNGIGWQFLKIEQELCHRMLPIQYRFPVDYVYCPLAYAFQTHRDFIAKYCTSERPILFLGINPGPKGMAQTGVPFGAVSKVRDWMQISGNIYKPEPEHPKRPVHGLQHSTDEVSGKRFWGFIQEICKSPENFFKNCFVYNFCPFSYIKPQGNNVTPSEMCKENREQISKECSKALIEVLTLMKTRVIVALGQYGRDQAVKSLKKAGVTDVQVEAVLHPSPRASKSVHNWYLIVAETLQKLGIMKYLTAETEMVEEFIKEMKDKVQIEKEKRQLNKLIEAQKHGDQ